MISSEIKEGFISFKFIKGKDFPPLKDIAYSELFNLYLEAHVENKSLVLSNNERRTLFYEGDLKSISVAVTKRDLIEPKIFHTYSYTSPQDNGGILHISKLSQGEAGTERTFLGTMDMCVAVIDPRSYINNPEYDLEIIGYINTDNFLCYRTSLDDFEEEFVINKVPSGTRLVKIGLNSRFKFQFLLSRKNGNYYYA